MITQIELRKLFTYTQDTFCNGEYTFTGALLWNLDNRDLSPRIIGRISQFGVPLAGSWGMRKGVPYCRINIDGKLHYMHRLIWVYHKGDISSSDEIDHRDVNSLNSVIGNLRKTERYWNAKNRKSCKGSESQYVGVSRSSGGKWRARYMFDRKEVNLGEFSSEIYAAIARDAGVKAAFGEFAHLNFPDHRGMMDLI